MTAWTGDELETIAATDELEIRSLLPDGTLGTSRTIWVVRIDDDLYVRSVDGRGSGWFSGTQHRREGNIQCGGVEKDVGFVDAEGDGELADRIDKAYHAKYDGRYPPSYIDDCLTPQARSATLKLDPRGS